RTSFCSIARTDVAVETSRITVTVIPNGGVVCPAVIAPLQLNVGVVGPGVSDLVVRTLDRAEIDRSKVIIPDAGADFSVSPVGGRIDGGSPVQIFGFSSAASVLFDGVPATDVHFEAGSLVVTPPAHAAGTVDVVLNDAVGAHKSIAAFTYFDRN